MAEMRGLTVKQPWAFAICHGKDVENRSWQPPCWLDAVAIHAGARSGWDAAGGSSPLVRAAWDRHLRGSVPGWPGLPESDVILGRKSTLLSFGAIVAVARVRTCHYDGSCWLYPKFDDETGRCSPWAAGDQWHWQLSDVCVLPHPVPCRGALGLWRLPEDVEKAAREQMEAVRHG